MKLEIEQQYDWWFCLQHVWQTIQVPQNAHSTQPGCPVHIEGDFPCSLCDTTFRTKKHLAHHVFNKHKERTLCSAISNLMTFSNGLHLQDPLHCLFALSLFWWPQPLRNISEWVFSFKGLGLLRTTLCAVGSFGKGKITAQNVGTKIGLEDQTNFVFFRTWCWAPQIWWSEKILQNSVQPRWPCVNRTPSQKLW